VAVENASLPGQRVWVGTIASLPRILEAGKPEGPVLLMIGEALDGVASNAEAFRFYQHSLV